MAWPFVLTRREPQLATVLRCKFPQIRTLRVREATWPGKGPVAVASFLRAASLHPVLGHAGTARHFLSLSRAQPPAQHPRASPALDEGSDREQRPRLCLLGLPPPCPPLAQKDRGPEEAREQK